ncbi:hypothetical protein AQUCO_01500339v1 [Aquilegia coerulea]|uniref:MutL C-terminal dimerisation domain-containing protein n=1 Tax=Aquilegia coerulea TaxID=218851 RepID=A0A2G5DU03_AQUCA|nr:hypothetical protein AQUCO_01500339v1 [Aquilegia coerulea]
MSSIKRLPKAVYSSLRSSVILFDLTRVVEELIYNSVDAGATKVSVAISVGESYVKVEDNGSGITRDGLVLLGERYATSKFHCLAEMDVASETFGFRGEALSSLSDISLIEVTTKAHGRPNGYRKIIKGCKCLYLGIDDNREEMGTTVVVRDLFYNQPVRRKCMQSSPKKVLHSVKKCVLQVALMHPQVSFKVTDIESNDEVLCTHPSPSPLPLVSSGFGIEVSHSLREVNFSKGIWKLCGYISAPVDTCSMKALQYIYINSRVVCKGPIHKLLNNLADCSICLDLWKGASGLQSGKRSRAQAYSAYILNLRCPQSSYDLTFEPSKTTVEFKDWVPVLSFIDQAIRRFWGQIPTQGELLGNLDDGKDEIWNKDDDNLSPIQDIFSEDLSLKPEITKRKHIMQVDQNSLRPASFPIKIAPEESDVLHPKKKYKRPYEEMHRNLKQVKEKEITDYTHQTDNTLREKSPSTWDAYGFESPPMVTQKNCIQLWQTDNDLLPVENYFMSTEKTGRKISEDESNVNIFYSRWGNDFLEVGNTMVVEDNTMPTELTGRQTSENDLKDNILGSTWGNDFLESAAITERSRKRLPTSSYYSHKKEVPLTPKFPKGLNKPYLRRCSLPGDTSPVANVLTNCQGFESDECGIQRKQLAPNDMFSDQKLGLSPQISFSGMFATSSHSTSVLTRHHTVPESNVLSIDFVSRHPTDEVSFSEKSDLLDNSFGNFGKLGSNRLSTSSAWSSLAPYSPFGSVTRKIGNFTDECAPNKNFLPCKSLSSFRDRESKDEILSYPDMRNSFVEEDPVSSCTNTDLDYEYRVKYFSESPSPAPWPNDSLVQRAMVFDKSPDETDWLCQDSSVTEPTDICAAPIMHIASPCYHEDRNLRERPQKRGLPSFHKGRSWRSHSAPPFCKRKSKFSTIYNCLSTVADEPSSPTLRETGDFKQSSEFCSGSQHHSEQIRAKESPLYCGASLEMMPYGAEYVGEIQKGNESKKPQCDQLNSPDLVQEIHNEVEDLELSGMKWRDGNPLTAVVYDRDISQNLPEQNDILDISAGLLHLGGGSVVPESITKDCLEDAKVLLQLDKKFIPIVAGATLAVIDQHAADERIRLEELRQKVLSGEGKSVAYLEAEQELALPEIGYQLLLNYSEQIQNWGWICSVNSQGSGSFTRNLNLLHKRASQVILLAVPCVLGVNLSDKDLLEFLEQLAETDGSSTLPPSVIRVLNYKACRGAIMFGDALLPSECSLIVEELRKTSLCFQCAHGRPTTVPLVNLEALRKQVANLNKWNRDSDEPWHGLHQHRPSLERASQRLISAGDQCG